MARIYYRPPITGSDSLSRNTLRSKDAEHLTAESVKPYQFQMSEIDGFRYRVMDALRRVTQTAVREARLKEIRAEILNSDKLKAHFQDNPRDLQVLRHDKNLHVVAVDKHLKHVPSYLVPRPLKATFKPDLTTSKRKFSKKGSHQGKQMKDKFEEKFDPLQTFQFTKQERQEKRAKLE